MGYSSAAVAAAERTYRLLYFFAIQCPFMRLHFFASFSCDELKIWFRQLDFENAKSRTQ